jgi:hypothetical protein
MGSQTAAGLAVEQGMDLGQAHHQTALHQLLAGIVCRLALCCGACEQGEGRGCSNDCLMHLPLCTFVLDRSGWQAEWSGGGGWVTVAGWGG